MTPNAKNASKLVDDAIQHAQVFCLDPQALVSLIICTTSPIPTSVLWQLLDPLEWIHLPTSPSQHLIPYHVLVCDVVPKARAQLKQLMAAEASFIIVPYSAQQQAWLWSSSEEWQLAFANVPGNIDCHYPSNKLL